MRKFILAVLVVGILAGSVGVAISPVSALTVDELQTQIRKLLSKVADLQGQLKLLGVSSPLPTDPAVISNPVPIQHRICNILNRNLSRGVAGDDVVSLQEFLQSEGYFSANATGYFGSVTAQAVAKWQAAEGVAAIGSVGPLSRERIKIRCGEGIKNNLLAARPVSGSAPLTVTFAAQVTLTNPAMVADAGDYKIVFGDGSEQVLSCASATGTCQGPHGATHTYTADGSYTATLVHYGFFGPPEQSVNGNVKGKVGIKVGDRPVGCTKEYKPVCAAKPIVCITTPCDPIAQTYGNRCVAEADGAKILYEGMCRNDSANKPPVVSGFSGPTSLSVNESGTWTIQASDPESGNLSYSIIWGDERSMAPYASASMRDSFIQTSTFSHSYASAGIYTVVVVVTDSSGAQAKTSATVRVGDQLVACTLEYNPVCGRPSGCANTCPSGQYCTMMCRLHDPVTYSNRCHLNAAGAEFLYAGACTTTNQ